MRRLSISHLTEYLFPALVSLLPHRMLLRPRENHNVRIEFSVLVIFPAHTLQWKRDVLDNSVAVAAFPEPSDRLRIYSSVVICVVIQHYDDNPFDFLVEDYAVIHPFHYAPEDEAELAPFQQAIYPADREAVQRWMDGLGLQQPVETFALLNTMNRAIVGRLGYQMREEAGVQSPAQTLARNSGSCRDFAALFMEACRHLGLASRFVSGYLDRRPRRLITPRPMPGPRFTCPVPAGRGSIPLAVRSPATGTSQWQWHATRRPCRQWPEATSVRRISAHR